MKLPDNAIGISDMLAYRECPQRFAWSMRRHQELPERFQTFEGETDSPPESTNWTNAYGSAIHDAIATVERKLCSDEEAIAEIWPRWQHYLDPEDVTLMKADLEKYRHRALPVGYRVVAVEQDMRVPLFVHRGVQIYFRFKLDVLMQHIQNPSIFVSRDYKATKWPRSHKEIQGDIQQWAYNWGIHELYPECETLLQEVDQLRAGVVPVRKTQAQRDEIKQWLILQATAVLEDDTLAPTQNEWCAYCPLLMECSVTHRSTDFWLRKLAAVAPERKVGRKIMVQLSDSPYDMGEYVELLPKAKMAQNVLKRYIEAVQDALKAMPTDRRRQFGYYASERSRNVFTASALREIFEMVGPDVFFHLVTLSTSGLESWYGKGKNADPQLDEIMRFAEKTPDAVMVKPVRSD